MDILGYGKCFFLEQKKAFIVDEIRKQLGNYNYL